MKLDEEKSRDFWKSAVQYAVKQDMTINLIADSKVECTNLVDLFGCTEVENLKINRLDVRASHLLMKNFRLVISMMKKVQQVSFWVILFK